MRIRVLVNYAGAWLESHNYQSLLKEIPGAVSVCSFTDDEVTLDCWGDTEKTMEVIRQHGYVVERVRSCPTCGAIMARGATKCLKCLTALPGQFTIPATSTF